MMRCHGYLLIPLAVASVMAHAQVQIGSALDPSAPVGTIEVFRRGNQTISNANGATVYVVDELKAFTNRLSVGLPSTEQAAQTVAQARLQALTDRDKAWIRHAATAQVRAAEYGLTKTPAIVFNGQAVVYGIPDVQQARSIYLRWRNTGGRP